MAGAGTSSTSHTYTYTDGQLLAYGTAVVYYRLRQLDTDGTSTYSPVRNVAVPASAIEFTRYPNPAHEMLTIVGTTTSTLVQVVNALGQVVLTANADASGTTQLTLPTGLPAGMYLVRSGSQTKRLVIQ